MNMINYQLQVVKPLLLFVVVHPSFKPRPSTSFRRTKPNSFRRCRSSLLLPHSLRLTRSCFRRFRLRPELERHLLLHYRSWLLFLPTAEKVMEVVDLLLTLRPILRPNHPLLLPLVLPLILLPLPALPAMVAEEAETVEVEAVEVGVFRQVADSLRFLLPFLRFLLRLNPLVALLRPAALQDLVAVVVAGLLARLRLQVLQVLKVPPALRVRLFTFRLPTIPSSTLPSNR